MKPKIVTLTGEFIRLRPMKITDLDELYQIGCDEELWKFSPKTLRSSEDMRLYIETALKEKRRGVSLPFVTIEKSSNKIVGSTRFGNIDTENLRTEIGWTWLTPKWQRTVVNTEAKFLMLQHAFEVWNCIRVEFRTDVLNEKSRNAILRLGAVQEGILRQQMTTDKGRHRDSIYFSILDKEWQDVKRNLLAKLGRG
jgi:N-acetyltransferase